MRTNDPVVISEGSSNAIQVGILVPDGYALDARKTLLDADLGIWLRRQLPAA